MDFIGSYLNDFMLSTVDVYVDIPGTGLRFLGETRPEKTLSFPREYAEYMTGLPKTLFAKSAIQNGLTMSFSFMQVADYNWHQLALLADVDTSDSTYDFSFFGSNPGSLTKYSYRFVTQTHDERAFELVVRSALLTSPGDMSLGADDYASQEVMIEATRDTTIADRKRDLAYFRIGKRVFS